MINNEDIEILEHSLFSIKQIASLLTEMEQYYNTEIYSKDGLTKRQAEIILYLNELPVSPSLRELSRLVSTSHQNVKQICNILEKDNLIRYTEDLKDKRKTLIRLTMKGEGKATIVSQSLKKISAKLASDLKSNDIDDLARLLRKVQFLLHSENDEIRKKFNN